MEYDFKTCAMRAGSGSSKWLDMLERNPEVGADIVPFSVADMEFKTAPEIVAGLKEYLDNAVLGYTQATDAYYGAVTGWMKRRHAWEVRKEWIVPTPGVVAALGVAVNAFTQPGEGVIIMTPVYYPFYMVVNGTGRKLVENPLREAEGGYEIDFDDLEQKAGDRNTKLLILCSPHNPVGRVWTKEELARVGEICERCDVLPVVDEIHHDLIMPGYRHTVFPNACGCLGERYVVCTAPSKTFNLAGMQTSNIVIPDPALRKRFEETKRMAAMLELNILGYKACELAYTQCEAWLSQLVGVIDQNRRLAENFFAANLPRVKVTRLEGTYLQWLDFRAFGIPYRELERIMAMEAQVFFDEGYIFGTAGQGFERLNLACPKDVLLPALERVEKAMKAK